MNVRGEPKVRVKFRHFTSDDTIWPAFWQLFVDIFTSGILTSSQQFSSTKYYFVGAPFRFCIRVQNSPSPEVIFISFHLFRHSISFRILKYFKCYYQFTIKYWTREQNKIYKIQWEKYHRHCSRISAISGLHARKYNAKILHMYIKYDKLHFLSNSIYVPGVRNIWIRNRLISEKWMTNRRHGMRMCTCRVYGIYCGMNNNNNEPSKCIPQTRAWLIHRLTQNTCTV